MLPLLVKEYTSVWVKGMSDHTSVIMSLVMLQLTGTHRKSHSHGYRIQPRSHGYHIQPRFTLTAAVPMKVEA